MSALAVSLAFFDPAHRLSGTLHVGASLLFDGSAPTTLPEAPEIEAAGSGWRARIDDRRELEFEPLAVPAELDGSRTSLCRVTGTFDATRVDCLGTATETLEAPRWAELDAVRAISAVFDPAHALFVLAKRPRGARGHGEESVHATILHDGELLQAEEARLSTVYDGDGRQRSAGVELWLADEDFPRRASGAVEAGASLSLDGLRVNAAVFRWKMDAREGRGAYDLALRDEREAA